MAERRRAVELAQHYRQAEGLSIAQIAGRLGRSPATVKAYFYDPSDNNKRPARPPSANAGFGATRVTYSTCVSVRSPLASAGYWRVCWARF